MIRRALSRLVGWLTEGIGETDAMGVPIVNPLPEMSKVATRRLFEMRVDS
jgi:hypothetical protein